MIVQLPECTVSASRSVEVRVSFWCCDSSIRGPINTTVIESYSGSSRHSSLYVSTLRPHAEFCELKARSKLLRITVVDDGAEAVARHGFRIVRVLAFSFHRSAKRVDDKILLAGRQSHLQD